MSTQVWVPGPAEIYVGTGTSGALEFLGVTDQGVRPRISAAHEDVNTDFSGMGAPEDVQFFPGTAVTTLNLVRYSEAVLQKLMGWIAGGTAGEFGQYAVGTLMVAESKAMRFLVVGPYSAKGAFAGMLASINFPISFPVDSFEIPFSTRARRPVVIMRSIPAWDKVNATATLFNSDVSGLPSPAIS